MSITSLQNGLSRKIVAGVLGFVICAAAPSIAFAQEDAGGVMFEQDGLVAADMGFATGEPSPAHQPYKESEPTTAPDPTEPANWYTDWQNWKTHVKDTWGTSFELYINPSAHTVVSGPSAGTSRGVLWFNLHLEQTLWKGARIVSNTRGGEGEGLNRYVDSRFNINKNQDEHNHLYISHLFLEQKLVNDRLTLAAGKMDLLDSFDTNEVGSWNFIPYSMARNPSIPAPYHAFGFTARFDAADWIYAEAGVADGEGGVGETGVNTAFDDDEDYFSIFAIGIKPKFYNRPGTYRFIFWHDTQTSDRFDGQGTENGDSGVALSFDQQINDRLGLFARYGYANADVREINHFWSFGGTVTEPIAGRTKDTLGFGIAQVFLNDDYREANDDISSTQTQFDLYYTIHVQPWVSVTPNLQMILNPDRGQDHDAAVIAGINVEMRF